MEEQVSTGLDVPAIWCAEGAEADFEGLRIVAVSPHGWRVTDSRVPSGDRFGFLAFIEQRGDVYEVIRLGVGLEWHEFDSLQAAARFVAETGARTARPPRRDLVSPPA